MGRLTRDPEIRYTQGEESKTVARFTLAVDRRYKQEGQQSADFISCVAFGKTADFMERYTRKGTKLVVEGRIQTGSYTNKDGSKVYTTDVVVDNVEFAESKAASEDGQAQSNRTQGSSPSRPDPNMSMTEGFMNIPDGLEDEGLPFD